MVGIFELKTFVAAILESILCILDCLAWVTNPHHLTRAG